MANVDDLPRIYFFRSGVQVVSMDKDDAPAMGERGILVVGTITLHAIERTTYEKSNCVRLPIGLYECTMEKTEKVGRGFRIKESGEYGHNKTNIGGILAKFKIHSANYPHEISGCIAPGRTILDNGVGGSRDAMRDIFTFCGGYGDGKKLMLDVDSL
jgi:hypothetical protein